MNLIIQANNEVSDQHIDHLAKLVDCKRHEKLSANSIRFLEVSVNPSIATYCFENRLDYGFVSEGLSLNNFKLVVMDMDSTLITIECIDEIADMHNLKPQVSLITEAAMRGEIDFSQSLTRRVALLEGLDEDALQRVYDQRLVLSPGADKLVSALKARGIKTLLVSGGFKFFTERLKNKLGLDFTQANSLEIINGKLTGKLLGKIFDAQGKADYLLKVSKELNLQANQVITIGDGANDLKMMAQSGLSVAYHAKPIVQDRADYAFNFVGLDGLLNLLAD